MTGGTVSKLQRRKSKGVYIVRFGWTTAVPMNHLFKLRNAYDMARKRGCALTQLPLSLKFSNGRQPVSLM
jgi:hypothetical protein